MRENYMHYTTDTKEYFASRGGGGGGGRGPAGGGGAFRGPGGGRGSMPGVTGSSHSFMRGGGYGAGGYPWGSHGYGRRFASRYSLGYPIGYQQYPAFPSLCTEINKDPFSTGVEIQCCPGLSQCYGDWNNDENPYYVCKKYCDE
jgi:hypothetical protein